MAELKMPEINYVIVAGNLTKDPIFRQTTNSELSIATVLFLTDLRCSMDKDHWMPLPLMRSFIFWKT